MPLPLLDRLVLAHLLAYDQPTITTVAETADCGRATAHAIVHRLIDLGLAELPEGTKGTLRPAVRVVG